MSTKFFDEAIPMLRVLINDLGTGGSFTYSDVRLEELLCVAAKLVLSENFTFDYSYSVYVSTHIIDPDPITVGDNAFFNFICLKAACISDVGTLRSKSPLAGIIAKMGPASLETRNHLDGFIKILEVDGGPCKSYEQLKTEYMFGNPNICKVILSPFVSNDFDPQNLRLGQDNTRSRMME
jgi:hypothetical protein